MGADMDRRTTLKGLGAMAAAAAWPGALRAQPERTRPNIVLVVVDDMRFDEFGAGGHGFLRTPQIDRLVREGVNFTRLFHATPLCSPNRASILTGEFASKHGIYGNVSREQLSHRLRTISRHLQGAGYRTAHVGKWHMGDDPRPRPGYDFWVSFPAQGKIYDPDLFEDGRLHRVEGYVTDLLTDRALRFLRTRDRSGPFFLYLGHKAVHPDVVQRNDASLDLTNGMRYGAAPRHAGRYATAVVPRAMSARGPIAQRPKSRMVEHFLSLQAEPAIQQAFGPAIDPGTSDESIRQRAEMMLAVDDSLGAIRQELKAAGELDNTVILFTSDNGFFFGEHGLSIERRLPYEECIRMPLIVRYPPLASPGRTVSGLGSSTDIAPTIADLAGLPIPPHMQGRSWKAALGDGGNGPRRPAILTEYFSHDQPMPWLVDADYKSIRTDRYKYIHWIQRPEFDELYDLEADPLETANILGRDPALDANMRRLLTDAVAQSLGLSA